MASQAANSLSSELRDGIRDLPSGIVSITPTPFTMLESILGQQAAPDEKGNFQFGSLESGKYLVCAWREYNDRIAEIFTEPRHATTLNRKCATVEVDGVERKTVQLKQISISDFEQ